MTQFACALSVWSLTSSTGPVFAFVVRESNPRDRISKSVSYPLAVATYRDVLVLLHHYLLDNDIQHTTCVSSCGVPHDASGFCILGHISPGPIIPDTTHCLSPQSVRLIGLSITHTRRVGLHEQVHLR